MKGEWLWCAQVVKYNDGLKSQKYICWTRKQMRYLLGDHGISYITGLPAKKGTPTRVYDRGASCPSPPQNCSAITALYSPNPNPHTLTGALVLVRSRASSAVPRHISWKTTCSSMVLIVVC